MVEFEEMRQGLAFLEGDQGQKPVSGERQIESSSGFSVKMLFLLPRAGVAFAVVAVFRRPVSVHRLGRTLLFTPGEAIEKATD